MRVRDQSRGSPDCSGDAAAFVLGALEPDEAQRFLEHLEGCVVCRDEVDAFRGVVQALPMAAPQLTAPKALRRRIMGAVRQEPKQALVGSPRRPRGVAWAASRALAGVVAATVLVGAITAGVQLTLPGSGARVIQARVTGTTGRATLRITRSHGELVVRHLAPPPHGHVYEVWLKTPNRPPTPANVLFSVTASGSADLGLSESLEGVSEVLVTPEPDGGSPAPTHRPVIVAQLT